MRGESPNFPRMASRPLGLYVIDCCASCKDWPSISVVCVGLSYASRRCPEGGLGAFWMVFLAIRHCDGFSTKATTLAKNIDCSAHPVFGGAAWCEKVSAAVRSELVVVISISRRMLPGTESTNYNRSAGWFGRVWKYSYLDQEYCSVRNHDMN